MKKLLIAMAALLLPILGGCGYRIGSLMHPQINSIAIAPVVNETVSYNVAPQVRSLLCEAFQQDGSLELRRESNADCILYARVISISFKESTWSSTYNDDLYVPIEWTADIDIEYTVVVPGELKPLFSKVKVSGKATVMTGADMETGRVSGIRQAAYAAARRIVDNVTEGW